MKPVVNLQTLLGEIYKQPSRALVIDSAEESFSPLGKKEAAWLDDWLKKSE